MTASESIFWMRFRREQRAIAEQASREAIIARFGKFPVHPATVALQGKRKEVS